MTLKEYEQASPEERAAEFERCKDEAYFYNTYWKKEGMPEYSRDVFQIILKRSYLERLSYTEREIWFGKRVYPMLPDDLKHS